MKHLYFVRHGITVMNQEGVFSGMSDTPLNDEGREQSVAAGQELKAAGIDCIVSSPLSRTMETAQIIAKQIGYPVEKIQTNDFFIERDFGPLEGTPYQGHLSNETEGVETKEALIARTQKGLDFLKTLDCENILVVSHGAVGRALRHCVDPSIPYYPSQGFANAKVFKLV